MNSASDHFDLKQCSDEAMFLDVIAFHDSFLPAATRMTPGELLERYRCCPQAFTCVLSNDDRGTHLRGYFVLLPLNETGAGAIRSGSVSSGQEIGSSYLATSGSVVTAVYLSVVCAVTPSARVAAISGVVNALRTYYHQHNVRHLFVRAATTAGSRMLQRLIRTSFRPDGLIHEVDLSTYTTITSPVRVPFS
jgi:hypothetical protein